MLTSDTTETKGQYFCLSFEHKIRGLGDERLTEQVVVGSACLEMFDDDFIWCQ